MKHRIFLLCLLAYAMGLLGCAVAIPVHEDDSSQTLGKDRWDIAMIGAVGPTEGPRNFPSGSAPNVADVIPEEFFGARVAWGIRENYDVEGELGLSMFGGTVASLGIKHQWYGPSYFKARAGDSFSGMRFRYSTATGFADNPSTWSSTDSASDIFGNGIFVDNMSAETLSIANSWGHLLTDWFGVYAGLEAGMSNLRATLSDGGPTGTEYSDNRYTYFGGPLAGFSLHSTGESVRVAWTFELEYLSVPDTFTNGNTLALFDSTGIHFAF